MAPKEKPTGADDNFANVTETHTGDIFLIYKLLCTTGE